jgi:glycine/D-amino acid oxidase-like deaminating enzyme
VSASDDACGHANPRSGALPQPVHNTGHGQIGWTMACGTAKITADLIAGRKPGLPLDGLTLR